MRPTALTTSILLAVASTSLAANEREQLTTNVAVEVSFDPGGECRATLTRYARKPPYERPTGRTYRLPKDQRQFVSALRNSGPNRSSASVRGKLSVPEACSGHAINAIRLAEFREIGFWFPPPVESGDLAELVSVCEVAADPVRFRGRRVKMRGPVTEHMSSDGISYAMVDMDCRRRVEIRSNDSSLGQPFRDRGVRKPVAVMTITGTPYVASCYQIPPGSTCGTRVSVEKIEDVESPDLCWAYRRVDQNSYEPITGPCQSEDLR